MLKDLILANRSRRRFYENTPVDLDTLKELVDLGRCSASGSNMQPLKYILSCTPDKNAKVFSTLSWAGSLPDWPGPSEGERPSAYIVILGDTEISRGFGVDHGIAAQSILLGATERDLGGCMLGAVNRENLARLLEIPERYQVLLVVAIGKPGEKVVLETLEEGGDQRYWRDAEQTHHVQKRRLEDIIIG